MEPLLSSPRAGYTACWERQMICTIKHSPVVRVPKDIIVMAITLHTVVSNRLEAGWFRAILREIRNPASAQLYPSPTPKHPYIACYTLDPFIHVTLRHLYIFASSCPLVPYEQHRKCLTLNRSISSFSRKISTLAGSSSSRSQPQNRLSLPPWDLKGKYKKLEMGKKWLMK